MLSFVFPLTDSPSFPSFSNTVALLIISGLLLTICCICRKNKNLQIKKWKFERQLSDDAKELNKIAQDDDNSLLTRWIEENPKLFHPQSCVEKREELGQGQFATVYKGNFKCKLTGNAK